MAAARLKLRFAVSSPEMEAEPRYHRRRCLALDASQSSGLVPCPSQLPRSLSLECSCQHPGSRPVGDLDCSGSYCAHSSSASRGGGERQRGGLRT